MTSIAIALVTFIVVSGGVTRLLGLAYLGVHIKQGRFNLARRRRLTPD